MLSNRAVAAKVPSPRIRATVFIVDDDGDVRRSLALLARSVDLDAEPYGSAHEFLEAFDQNQQGCLLLDVRMPGRTGLQLQQELIDRGIRLPIIFITAHGEIPTATAAMRAGALDFILKPFSPQSLLDRIQEAIALDHKNRRAQQKRQEIGSSISKLTNREREVMQLLAEGDSTKVIASRLGISPKTVDNHRAKVLEKMGVDNMAQLARLATLSAL